jgi:2-keto-3-deoxy-L-rhamnonate aldolase RhmA
MIENPVKRRLSEGGTAFGTFVYEFATPGVARLAVDAGAEFVVFDQEHTGLGLEAIRMLTASARAHGVMPVVRVPDAQYHLIAGALDAGAMGVMVPRVESAKQARLVVESATYPPQGRRGIGTLHPEELLPGGLGATLEEANRQVLVMLQVETRPGLEAADEIAAVESVDVLWIGPNDLTASLGIPGRYEDSAYGEAVDRLLEAAARHGKALGMSVASVEDGRSALGRGFRALGYRADLWLYRDALRAGLDALRAV